MDDRFRIETPESVTFGYDVAGIGSRFIAALVDTVLIALIQALIVGVSVGVMGATLGAPLDSPFAPWILAALGLLAFGLLWGYYLLFEMLWNGQSPGKRWVGLRVIKTSGAPISLVDSAIRNLVRLVDFLPAYYGVGVIVMFLNADARRLGDYAAGTMVVREGKGIALDSLTSSLALPQQTTQGEPIAGLENLTADDYDLLARFLRRSPELTTRTQVARKLAAGIQARMGLPVQSLGPEAAERFLVQVASAYRRQAASGDPDNYTTTPAQRELDQAYD